MFKNQNFFHRTVIIIISDDDRTVENVFKHFYNFF